jgi:hypothetical protein
MYVDIGKVTANGARVQRIALIDLPSCERRRRQCLQIPIRQRWHRLRSPLGLILGLHAFVIFSLMSVQTCTALHRRRHRHRRLQSLLLHLSLVLS